MPALASAEGYNDTGADGANILNGQVNLNTVWSTTELKADYLHENSGASAMAVGNQAQIFTMSDTHVRNDQNNMGDIGADLHANIQKAGGNVVLSSTAMCNGAMVSTDPAITAVRSNQVCGADDPVATVNAKIGFAGGGVGVQAMSMGNQLEVDSNAARFPVKNYQENTSTMFSSANVKIGAAKAASVSSVAVGNTAQIIHY